MSTVEFHRDFSHKSLPHHFKFGCNSDDDLSEELETDPDSDGNDFVLTCEDIPERIPEEESDDDSPSGAASAHENGADVTTSRSDVTSGQAADAGSGVPGAKAKRARGQNGELTTNRNAAPVSYQRPTNLADNKLPTIVEHASAIRDASRPTTAVPDHDVTRQVVGSTRLPMDGIKNQQLMAHLEDMINRQQPKKRHTDAELSKEALDLQVSMACYAARRRSHRTKPRQGLKRPTSCGSVSRNVKTAPSTPESENNKLTRHAESTSHLEMSASYGKRSGVKGMENVENVKPPDKKVTANMSKSRNEKFHKLFKNIPEKEKVLKSCLCAYVGDILLQGYFYILPSYFCFYTKILGHEKQLEIPVSEVLNITREKTALFIPNAIGVQTKTEKYVFGSLMSRDSTYSLMCSVWKKKIPNAQVSDLKASDSDSSTGQDYIAAQDGVSSVDDDAIPSSVSGSDVSEDSLCPSCGMPLIEHERDRCRRDDVKTSKTEASLCNGTVTQRSAGDQTGQHESIVHRSHPAQKAGKNRQKQSTTSPDGGPVGWLNSISRTSALLMTCVIIAIVLVLLAAFMSYKILVLQTQIDLANQLLNPSFSKYEQSRKLYSDLYYLNDRYHTSTIERFHNILEANIELLSQVHASLFSLHKTSNLSGEQHSCQKSDDCQENS